MNYANKAPGDAHTIAPASSNTPDAVKTVLVTGGSGFFGGVLKRNLLRDGFRVVNIDLERDEDSSPNLVSVQGDIRDQATVTRLFAEYRFSAVYHAAAQLAHGLRMDEKLLWTSNVDGTRILAEAARQAGVRPFVFVSTNCLWASNLGRPIHEQDAPAPVELYGHSKLAAEQLLQDFAVDLEVVVIRCPTIMDAGRLGLLAILFEFIDDGKTVWVVGDGSNRYQFIYAEDLAEACKLAAGLGRSDLLHIGSDNVLSMREVYEAVIRQTGSSSKVRSLPRGATIGLMKLAHRLGVSPLGPYHYKMIAESFLFDNTRIKQTLGWQPTLTNDQMLLLAHNFYSENRKQIAQRKSVSAHRKPASMGIIRALKWIS